MSKDFDPYYHWLGIPEKDQPPNHYRLLGIERFEEHAEVIAQAADRQMAHVRTFQAGPRSAESQMLLNEIAKVRLCLLDPEQKAAYDARLRRDLAEEARSASLATNRVPDGAAFGRYALLDQVGESRTGKVFKAEDRTLGRRVALKVLSDEAVRSPALLERFLRKARILAGLSHRNLVAAYEAGELDGKYYLVMEFVDGTDMNSLSKCYGPLPVAQVVNYIAQAAAGLGHAHDSGIYHRNVKPSNLLLDRQGVVKVIGLGIARIEMAEGAGSELTAPGQVLGTCDFMAPEQAIDTRTADHRADIYSLGCTMFKLLTSRAVYPEKSMLKKVVAHRELPIPSLQELRPDVPASLEFVFGKMLAKSPEDRFQSMNDLIAAL